MACRDAYKTNTITEMTQNDQGKDQPVRLLFGVNSKIRSDDLLQNNIDMFEWVTRNKLYPNFWGRNILGGNAITKDEIKFLHDKGCKIVAICNDSEPKETEAQGKLLAKKAALAATELGMPENAAIFLEIEENAKITKKYLRGFAKEMFFQGYTPGFKANTDAKFNFDREFSRGIQTDQTLFRNCLIWAVAPSLAEFNGITTTHLLHPDEWKPFAPSGVKRKEIAVWQYGKDCHPIDDDDGMEVTFNVDLIRNAKVFIDGMF